MYVAIAVFGNMSRCSEGSHRHTTKLGTLSNCIDAHMGANQAVDLLCQPDDKYDGHLGQVDPITRIPWGVDEEVGLIELGHDEEE